MSEAKQAFPQAGWEARSRLNVSPEFSRDLDRFAEFLTLAGLLSLVVGGVGVANAAHGFVERKRATLAILKAIGATGASVVGLALLEFSIVALIGALVGAALGASIPFAVDWLFGSLLPIPLAPSIEPSVIALGLAFGLLTALAFSIAPLGRAHDLPVTTLIRDLAEERQGWPRKRYLASAALAGAALVALAIVTSPQRPVAAYVAGATLVAFAALRFVAFGLALLARRAPKTRFVEWRMALAAIQRPGASDGVGSAVPGLGPGGAGCAYPHRREYARRAASIRARRDAELLFPRCSGRRRRRVSRLPEARGARRQNQRDADDARALRPDRGQAGRGGQGRATMSPGPWKATAA